MRSNKDTVRNNIEDICRGDTVALSYEEYKNMKARIELLEVLAEAEDDAKMAELLRYLRHSMI